MALKQLVCCVNKHFVVVFIIDWLLVLSREDDRVKLVSVCYKDGGSCAPELTLTLLTVTLIQSAPPPCMN